MEPEIATHDAKRNRIETALGKLLEAREIDERESLLEIEKWIAWYDATIPLVTDIRIIAGAMEVELSKRRGMRMEAEPQQPGRPVTPGVTLSISERKVRSRDRALGRNPAAVDEYVKTEAHARRVPTRKGAARHVKRPAGQRPSPRPTLPSLRVRSSAPTRSRLEAAAHAKTEEYRKRTLSAIDRVADGPRRSDPALKRAIGGDVEHFLRGVRLIPWLYIDRTQEGTALTIDRELREICEGRAPRPALEGFSIRGFLKHLRENITRRRKENHDEREKARWSTQAINSREQTDLLDWIELELDRVP
jgi:hypothetical protein